MVSVSTTQNREGPYPAVLRGGRIESLGLPATNNNNRRLYSSRAHWLVDWFPDELVIQEKTISVIRNDTFFLASYVETMPVRDIGRVVYIKTPLFGSLRIIGKNTQHELRIKGLKNDQALKAKEVIEGLLLEDAGVVDVPHWVEADDRLEILAKAGRDPGNQGELYNRFKASY